MRISGARPEPFTATRPASAPDKPQPAPSPVDQAQALGIPESELTPAVQAAVAMLAGELEDLRSQIKRLRAQLLEAEAAADADPLTGVKNRRAFVRELGRICAFAQRYGAPAALIYIDLDDLKGINDRLGHAVGDAALRQVAETVRAHVRESDVIGRLGGDEFAVALMQTDHAAAAAKAEALAALIQAGSASTAAANGISFGVVEIDPSEDAETLIARADRAMFAMKRARG